MNLGEAEDIVKALVRHFEGFYSRPYLCPAKVPTIGYGFTHYPDGRRVTLLDPPITREQAEQMLTYFVRTKYLREVLALCPGATTAGQLGALGDFDFNLGGSNLKASTLRRRVNAGDWDRVPDEFRKWTRGGGRVLRGLVLRREAEINYL